MLEMNQTQPQAPKSTATRLSRLEKLFSLLSKQPSLHARFVNTLSYLEYVGARKILKSQPSSTFSTEILGHAAEEIRHAMVFKKVAMHLSQGALDTYEKSSLLCGTEAGMYFLGLDRSIEKELDGPDAWLNYLYTTLLIEERANELYPAYDPHLSAAGFPGALRGILAEERKHLREIEKALSKADPKGPQRLERLRQSEAAMFETFLEALLRTAEADFSFSQDHAR